MKINERRILRCIEENPLADEKTIARELSLSEKEVSEIIADLTEKGYIGGMGFVVKKPPYVCVVGGINIDISGKSTSEIVPGDSNPGVVSLSMGGVGRNIAHNLSLLGIETKMLTAVGDDENSERVKASCGELGIDLSRANFVQGGRTSTYLYVSAPNGDMLVGINDMEICERISPEYLSAQLEVLNRARAVVFDTNIPEPSIEYLANHVQVPLFCDPVSTIKAGKIKNVLGKINTLKPNLIEAEQLSGICIQEEKDLEKAADILLNTGIHRVFVSLGRKGVFAASKEEKILLPCYPVRAVNANGAGDAFTAGLVYCYLEGRSLKETALFAEAASALNCLSEKTNNPKMSPQEVEKIQKEYRIV
jgi:pseudouridine kinase